MQTFRTVTEELIALEDRYGAHNYLPLDVVLTRGEGVWVWDVDGNRYMDCLSAYSAVNQGHGQPAHAGPGQGLPVHEGEITSRMKERLQNAVVNPFDQPGFGGRLADPVPRGCKARHERFGGVHHGPVRHLDTALEHGAAAAYPVVQPV